MPLLLQRLRYHARCALVCLLLQDLDTVCIYFCLFLFVSHPVIAAVREARECWGGGGGGIGPRHGEQGRAVTGLAACRHPWWRRACRHWPCSCRPRCAREATRQRLRNGSQWLGRRGPALMRRRWCRRSLRSRRCRRRCRGGYPSAVKRTHTWCYSRSALAPCRCFSLSRAGETGTGIGV